MILTLLLAFIISSRLSLFNESSISVITITDNENFGSPIAIHENQIFISQLNLDGNIQSFSMPNLTMIKKYTIGTPGKSFGKFIASDGKHFMALSNNHYKAISYLDNATETFKEYAYSSNRIFAPTFTLMDEKLYILTSVYSAFYYYAYDQIYVFDLKTHQYLETITFETSSAVISYFKYQSEKLVVIPTDAVPKMMFYVGSTNENMCGILFMYAFKGNHLSIYKSYSKPNVLFNDIGYGTDIISIKIGDKSKKPLNAFGINYHDLNCVSSHSGFQIYLMNSEKEMQSYSKHYAPINEKKAFFLHSIGDIDNDNYDDIAFITMGNDYRYLTVALQKNSLFESKNEKLLRKSLFAKRGANIYGDYIIAICDNFEEICREKNLIISGRKAAFIVNSIKFSKFKFISLMPKSDDISYPEMFTVEKRKFTSKIDKVVCYKMDPQITNKKEFFIKFEIESPPESDIFILDKKSGLGKKTVYVPQPFEYCENCCFNITILTFYNKEDVNINLVASVEETDSLSLSREVSWSIKSSINYKNNKTKLNNETVIFDYAVRSIKKIKGEQDNYIVKLAIYGYTKYFPLFNAVLRIYNEGTYCKSKIDELEEFSYVTNFIPVTENMRKIDDTSFIMFQEAEITGGALELTMIVFPFISNPKQFSLYKNISLDTFLPIKMNEPKENMADVRGKINVVSGLNQDFEILEHTKGRKFTQTTIDISTETETDIDLNVELFLPMSLFHYGLLEYYGNTDESPKIADCEDLFSTNYTQHRVLSTSFTDLVKFNTSLFTKIECKAHLSEIKKKVSFKVRGSVGPMKKNLEGSTDQLITFVSFTSPCTKYMPTNSPQISIKELTTGQMVIPDDTLSTSSINLDESKDNINKSVGSKNQN